MTTVVMSPSDDRVLPSGSSQKICGLEVRSSCTVTLQSSVYDCPAVGVSKPSSTIIETCGGWRATERKKSRYKQ